MRHRQQCLAGPGTILRNFIFNEGDIIIEGSSTASLACFSSLTLLLATTTYGSISQTLKYIAELPSHPTLSIFNLRCPTAHAKIVREAQIKQLIKGGGITRKGEITVLIDAISSRPGVLHPWKETVASVRGKQKLPFNQVADPHADHLINLCTIAIIRAPRILSNSLKVRVDIVLTTTPFNVF